MGERKITSAMVREYKEYLYEEEKSKATIEKYMHDVGYFISQVSNKSIDKSVVIAYKGSLEENYAVASINSMLAALNGFLTYLGWHDCKVKHLKTQRKIFRSEERELTRQEYQRLVEASKSQKNARLNMIMQTITNTGIRISELSYITVEALGHGYAEVSCKGKTRTVFISRQLSQMLTQYAKGANITDGPIFVTRNGRPLNRSNVWREMKELCRQAGVDPQKVFPHNLRQLFACAFYSVEKDLVKLADILGHSNIETTRIYTRTSGKEHQQRIASLKLLMN